MKLTVDYDLNELDTDAADIACPSDVPAGLNGLTKRCFDLAIAIPLFIFILPLLAFISILIKSQSSGEVIFKQTRCGKDGKSFTCYKFRTMHMDASAALAAYLQNNPTAAAEWECSQKLQNDPRITAIGAFLRKTSLDELPQLVNIISGDMSLIGPRPVTFSETSRYGNKLAYYTAARPGVTGLWQVNGRNELSYQERVAFDALYAKEWSFKKDIFILLKTIPVVLFTKGAF